MLVRSIATQGRSDAAQWVTSYTLQFSLDEVNWTPIPNLDDPCKPFTGNTDQNTIVTHSLNVVARYVRLNVQTFHGHPSLRWGVFACTRKIIFLIHHEHILMQEMCFQHEQARELLSRSMSGCILSCLGFSTMSRQQEPSVSGRKHGQYRDVIRPQRPTRGIPVVSQYGLQGRKRRLKTERVEKHN